jgi:enoyl-[acyl-carrier-protein] reductase (NADH)
MLRRSKSSISTMTSIEAQGLLHGSVADAAVYLASPMSAFVHGSSLVVDGGSTWAS